MEKFYLHIEKLLAQHDYVVVPNLGGFIVQIQSARILSDRITPPHATIGFNALMSHSDGLLAIEISRTEQISYRKAAEYIDNEVERIKFSLKTSGSVIIGELGILQKNDFGSLTFSPIYKSNFLPQNLGLTDLYVKTKESRTLKEDRKVVIVMPSPKFIKYAAAAMLFFGLFFFSPHVSDVRQADYASLASISFENTTKISKPQGIKKDSVDTVKISEIAVPKISNDFHVVVASLPTNSSAEKFCNELIKDKFVEAHVLPSSRLYRVAIQSFPDRKKANEYMKSLRKIDPRFETAWVYSK